MLQFSLDAYKNSSSTISYLYGKGVLEYYFQLLLLFAFAMAVFGGLTIWSLSLLPWLTEGDVTATDTKNYFSHTNIISPLSIPVRIQS